MSNKLSETFKAHEYFFLISATLLICIFCICVGSVNIPVSETFIAVRNTLMGWPIPEGISQSIIVFVRLPRVICVALTGASLSLCGSAMQGLLRNPLADGSTLGVSTGASMGAVLAIAIGFSIPGIPGAGTMVMAMLFAFLTLVFILSLTYRLDYSMSTNTIILVGVIYSMFANSMISLIATFSGEKAATIMFWTMGSLAGSTYTNAVTLFVALSLCSAVLLHYAKELNAFAIGEDNARHIGIDVKKVKLVVMISVAILIGVCVSIGGSIGFVGLVIPHITRMITGPNHRRLLPASLFMGAGFLMLADLISRTILNPVELPIGVVTSIIGSVVFVYVFYSTRRVR